MTTALKYFRINFLIFSILIGGIVSMELPSDITRCQAADSPCIAKSASEFFKNSAAGRPEYGIPAFDPYTVPRVVINHENANNSVNLDLKLDSATVRGISKFHFDRVVGFERNPAKSKFELYGELPNLELEGKYKVKGRVLTLPIQGQGNFKMAIANSKMAIKFKVNVDERDGHKYLKITKLKLRLEPRGVKMQIDNLFEGNEEFGKTVNALINANWEAAWTEISPSVLPIAENTLKEIGQTIFDKFPYDQIYLQ